MQNAIVEQWETFGKSAMDAAKELETISTSVVEKLTEQQLAIASTCIETGVKQMTLVSEIKDYKELMSAQAKLATEYNEKLMSSAKKATEILNDARTQFTSWFEKGVSTAVTTSKKTTTAVSKKAA
jgi:phasin family protein